MTTTAPTLDDFGARLDGARKHRPRTSAPAPAREPGKARTTRPVKLRVCRWRDRDDWMIGKSAGGEFVEVASGFATASDARRYRAEHVDELDAAWKALKVAANPVLRRETNRARIGPPVAWDGDPEALLDRYGLRGVQFGNWMPERERREHVRAAVEALDDLADVLDVPSSAIGLGGRLGLAFGARGSGKFAAHYESDHAVVNLTRTQGAGSLAHEWLHALDHALADDGDDLSSRSVRMPRWPRRRHPAAGEFAAALAVLEPTLARFALAVTTSPVHERTRRADQFRSGAYHSRLCELLARGFEAAVVATLAGEGRRNDYLANIRGDSPVYLTVDEAGPVNAPLPDLGVLAAGRTAS